MVHCAGRRRPGSRSWSSSGKRSRSASVACSPQRRPWDQAADCRFWGARTLEVRRCQADALGIPIVTPHLEACGTERRSVVRMLAGPWVFPASSPVCVSEARSVLGVGVLADDRGASPREACIVALAGRCLPGGCRDAWRNASERSARRAEVPSRVFYRRAHSHPCFRRVCRGKPAVSVFSLEPGGAGTVARRGGAVAVPASLPGPRRRCECSPSLRSSRPCGDRSHGVSATGVTTAKGWLPGDLCEVCMVLSWVVDP